MDNLGSTLFLQLVDDGSSHPVQRLFCLADF